MACSSNTPTNRGEINFTCAKTAATQAPRRRTCTCTLVTFTPEALSWKKPQKNLQQFCKTNWVLFCRGTPKMTTKMSNTVDYSGLKEWSLHVGLYIYYFFKTNFDRNPWNERDAFVNGTLLMLVEPQLETNIPIYDANIRHFYLAQKNGKLGRGCHLLDEMFTELTFREPVFCFSSTTRPSGHWQISSPFPSVFCKDNNHCLLYKLLLRGLGEKCRVRAATSMLFYAKWIKMVLRTGLHCIST